MPYQNRIQFGFYLLIGLFLLAALFAILLFALVPATPQARGPILLTAFVAILIGTVACVLLVLRSSLRPYRQLLGEAERASVASKTQKSSNEGEFVLETFQSVVAQLQDQRKELERLTAQAGERADSAVRFSERIVASVPSGLIAFDGHGRSTVINAPGRALLGVDGKALGQPAAWLLRNIPELSEMVTQCLQTGKVYRREVIEVTTSGVRRQLGGTIAPIDLSPELGPRGALCLLTDITEVTRLREQVALKRNLESLGEMSAGLAHEFKNAIATLHGYAQLLQNLKLDEGGQAATDSLLNEVRNLSEMVTAFLNFARPQPLELETVSLSELLTECVTELEPLFNERRVELQFAASEGVPSSDTIIRADERMLRQALLNLLRNAAEAIPDHKIDRVVKIKRFEERNNEATQWAVIDVEDTGEGIPAADLERIFIPFFTTKASGHGVGLALAHRVVTQHGGTLTATNTPAGGAMFRVKLPLSV